MKFEEVWYEREIERLRGELDRATAERDRARACRAEAERERDLTRDGARCSRQMYDNARNESKALQAQIQHWRTVIDDLIKERDAFRGERDILQRSLDEAKREQTGDAHVVAHWKRAFDEQREDAENAEANREQLERRWENLWTEILGMYDAAVPHGEKQSAFHSVLMAMDSNRIATLLIQRDPSPGGITWKEAAERVAAPAEKPGMPLPGRVGISIGSGDTVHFSGVKIHNGSKGRVSVTVTPADADKAAPQQYSQCHNPDVTVAEDVKVYHIDPIRCRAIEDASVDCPGKEEWGRCVGQGSPANGSRSGTCRSSGVAHFALDRRVW